MRTLTLTEHQTSDPVELGQDERDALQDLVSTLTITPAAGRTAAYHLRPGAQVGIVRIDDLVVEILPKLPIERVLFLVSYALDPNRWRTTPLPQATADSLLEALIPTFVNHVQLAFRRGVLQGYRHTEEALATVRGRIRFADQIRLRSGIFPPIEVAYDDFTEDIVENRLVKAVLDRLRRIPIRSAPARRSLRTFDQVLVDVHPPEFDPKALPEVRWTRLNEHYRPAVELATLILRSTGLETRHGSSTGTAVLFNMNEVFENFVYVALREALGLSARAFPQGADKHPLHLDAATRVRLRPDLSWWEGPDCVFVGDVKYKKTDDGIKHPDLYQLLAYTVATDLPSGLLVYAAGEAHDVEHDVTMAGKRLLVRVLDLAGTTDVVLAQIGALATEVRAGRTSPRHTVAA